MTVKPSVSLSDDQHAFAKDLVERGKFLSISAVLQHGLELARAGPCSPAPATGR
jgi:antitoxin ParD1/3/4